MKKLLYFFTAFFALCSSAFAVNADDLLPLLEEFEADENPFLPKFYQEPDKYAFQVEMTFLALRFQQLKDKLSNLDLFHDFIISDYYVAKSLIFSKNNLQEDEYQLFARFFNIIFVNMPKPDLLVYLYLNVNQLQYNIRKTL